MALQLNMDIRSAEKSKDYNEIWAFLQNNSPHWLIT